LLQTSKILADWFFNTVTLPTTTQLTLGPLLLLLLLLLSLLLLLFGFTFAFGVGLSLLPHIFENKIACTRRKKKETKARE
jgi:hypothetical protein